MTRCRVLAIGLAIMLAPAACSSGAPPTVAAAPSGARDVYVALGNGETAGNGVKDRIRDAWPQIVYRDQLSQASIFANFGAQDMTVADALTDQLLPALALKPTVATVHLTDDQFLRTPVDEFERNLTTLVRRLRRDGRTAVVLGTILPQDREPGVLACTPNPPPNGPRCRIGSVDNPADGNARIELFNSAIRRVASVTGARLADVHAAFLAARAAGGEDALWAGNDFSPNAAGHQLLAREFGAGVRDALKSR